MIQQLGFSSSTQPVKAWKKLKSIEQLPPPYLNFMDPSNVDFLQYANQISSLRIGALAQNIITCNHRTIEAQIQTDHKNMQIKDTAFIGRSNVGKSSLVNYVSGIKLTKISKTPGKTQDLCYIDFRNQRRIIDFCGYGFARASQEEKEQLRKLMETYLNKSSQLHRVLLLIDLTTGVQDSDKMLLDMLTERTKTVSIVLTKADKVKANRVQKQTEQIVLGLQKSRLTMMMSPLVHLCSSNSGYGLHELMCGLCQTFSQEKLLQTSPTR